MQCTSAEANKMLKKLYQDHADLLQQEAEACVFTAATVENVEDARPPYDYADTQQKLLAIEKKIRIVKHAISVFNLTQEVPGTGMTIDQVLVYLPQLSARKLKLAEMKQRQGKKRSNSFNASSNFIEYVYANYDPEQAAKDYETTSAELGKIQNALDIINATVSFEINI